MCDHTPLLSLVLLKSSCLGCWTEMSTWHGWKNQSVSRKLSGECQFCGGWRKGTLVDWCEKQRRKLRAQGSLESFCLDGLRNVAAQESSETTNSLVCSRWQVSQDLPALHCRNRNTKLQNWEQALRESVHGDDLSNSPFP